MTPANYGVFAPALGLAWLLLGGCADSETGDPQGPLTMGPTSQGDAGDAGGEDGTPSTGSDSGPEDTGPDPTAADETGSDSAGSDDGGTDSAGETTGSDEPDPGSSACHACLMLECRAQLDACKSDPACTCHAVCVEGGGSPGQCYLPCEIVRPPTFDAMYECSLARCPDECPEFGS